MERLILSVLGMSFVLSFLFVFTVIDNSFIDRLDYKSFYTAATIIINEPGSLYDLGLQSSIQNLLINTPTILLPFKSPPIQAFFYVPFLFLSFYSSYKLFVISGLIIIIILNNYLINELELQNKLRYLFISTIFLPNLLGIYNGQAIFIQYALFMFIYLSSRNDRSFNSGVFTGLLFIKPQFLIAMPFVLLIQKDKRKYIYGFIISIVILLVISMLLVPGFMIEYYNLIISTESSLYGSHPTLMASLNAYLLKFTDQINSILINAVLYIVIYLNYIIRRSSLSFDMNFVISVLVSIIFSVHVWDHDLIILLIPFFLYVKNSTQEHRKYLSITMILAPFLFLSTGLVSMISLFLLIFCLILINYDSKLKKTTNI